MGADSLGSDNLAPRERDLEPAELRPYFPREKSVELSTDIFAAMLRVGRLDRQRRVRKHGAGNAAAADQGHACLQERHSPRGPWALKRAGIIERLALQPDEVEHSEPDGEDNTGSEHDADHERDEEGEEEADGDEKEEQEEEPDDIIIPKGKAKANGKAKAKERQRQEVLPQRRLASVEGFIRVDMVGWQQSSASSKEEVACAHGQQWDICPR